MKTNDTSLVKSVINETAIFQTIIPSDDGFSNRVKDGNIPNFLKSIASAKNGELDERYKIMSIKHDHALAQAWVPYEFYFKGKFSHKGTNQIVLVKSGGIWKIQYLIDTRIMEGGVN